MTAANEHAPSTKAEGGVMNRILEKGEWVECEFCTEMLGEGEKVCTTDDDREICEECYENEVA